MTEVSKSNFGLLIAYLIPGFVLVWTASGFSETLRSWMGAVHSESPTVGGFLYVTMASIAAGMVVSAIRWLVLDTIHHRTGVQRPSWDVSVMPTNLAVFQMFVEYHFRYYQFYGNLCLAVILASLAQVTQVDLISLSFVLKASGLLLLVAILFAASRDALQNYYARTNVLLRSRYDYSPTKRMDPQDKLPRA